MLTNAESLKLVAQVLSKTNKSKFAVALRHATREILFDLEHAISVAKNPMDRNLVSQCGFVSGEMFQNVPEGGELYILKSIITTGMTITRRRSSLPAGET